MLLTAIPALAVLWSLGGRLTALLEYPWRYFWLIWVSLGVQLILFTPYSPDLSETVVRVTHVLTYLPIVAFLMLNRDAGLAVTGLGIALNLIAITANGGLMPADASAQEVFYAGRTDIGQLNTDNESPRLLFLGDVMALPSWFPWANAFSVGDVLIAAGFVWAIAKVSLMNGAASRPALTLRINRETARLAIPLAVPAALVAGWTLLGAAIGTATQSGHVAAAAIALVAGLAPVAATSTGYLSAEWSATSVARLAAASAATAAAFLAIPAPELAAVVAAAAGGVLIAAPLRAIRVAPRGSVPSPSVVAAFASGAIGLALAATLLIGMAPTGPIALAAIVAALTARSAIPESSLLPSPSPGFRMSPFALRVAGFGVYTAIVGIGALAVLTTWHAATTLGMGPRTFSALGATVALGTAGGLLMAARLSLQGSPRVLGVALLFCSLSGGLLSTATLPMTAVGASFILGICGGLLLWLMGPLMAASEPGFTGGMFALGAALGGTIAMVAGVDLAWIACIPVGAAGLALIPASLLSRRQPRLEASVA